MDYIGESCYQEDLAICWKHTLGAEKLKEKNLLITGASGFLGGYLVDLLCFTNEWYQMGITIYAMGRNKKRLQERFVYWQEKKYLHLIEHDVNTPFKKDDEIKEIDYLIHAASNAFPQVLYTDPVGTIEANITGTINLLNLLKSVGGTRFLYVSSGEIYGKIDGVESFVESDCGTVDIFSHRSGYSLSKRCAENLCISYKEQYGLDCVIVRPCHTYGANYVVMDNRANAQFVDQAVHGVDIIMKSKGQQIRSYSYIADTISGMLSVLTQGEGGQAYNLSNSSGTVSILEFAQKVAEQAFVSLKFDCKDEQPSPFVRAVLNEGKLSKLGWQPAYTLETGVRRTLEIAKIRFQMDGC